MSDDSVWIDRAQSAEARLKTLQDQVEPLKQRVRDVMGALCAREQRDGSFSIDYAAFVAKLGKESAAELQKIAGEAIMTQAYAVLGQLVGKTVTVVSAEPGQKPKLRIHAEPKSAEPGGITFYAAVPVSEPLPRVKRKYTKRKAA